MGKLFYIFFIHAYQLGIGIASYFNPKAKLWVQGRKQFPFVENGQQKTVWMHCASLGEFEQGRPLLEAVKKQYPHIKTVLTFFSPSGYEVMKHYPGADYIFYLPMDSKANADRMIDSINPCLVLWVKYEFWYYYLTGLKKRNITVLMVSGIFRDNQPFFKWYGGIWKKMLQCFTHFFVQNEESAELLLSVGIKENVSISGDTRFDRVIEIAEKFEPLPLIEKFCGNSKVIVAGSTWDDDEAAWIHYVRKNPDIKFIIAPHEIDAGNIKEVMKEFTGAVLYSELEEMQTGDRRPTTEGQKYDGKEGFQTIDQQTDNYNQKGIALHPFRGWGSNVLIIDNIGMLSKLYYYADITFVGGGFNEGGIHNVLEAAVYGKPVIYAPEYEKFAEAIDLVECKAGICINNAVELENVLIELWNNEALLKEKSEAAKKYVYANAGATKKIMNYIQEKRLLTS